MNKLTIPKAAMPVVEILRRDVERPTATLIEVGAVIRFECGKCPMGLHRSALIETPSSPSVFSLGSPLAVKEMAGPEYAFWNWWDHLTIEQAQEAVDLIWPETKLAALSRSGRRCAKREVRDLEDEKV